MAINRFHTFTPGDYTLKYIPTEFTNDLTAFEPMFKQAQEDKIKAEALINAMKPKETQVDNQQGVAADYYARNMAKKQEVIDAFANDYDEGMRKLRELQQYIVTEKTAGEYAAIQGNYEAEQKYLEHKAKMLAENKWREPEKYLAELYESQFQGTKYDRSTGKYSQYNVENPTDFIDLNEALMKINPSDFGLNRYNRIIRTSDGKLKGVTGYFGDETITELSRGEAETVLRQVVKSGNFQGQIEKEALYQIGTNTNPQAMAEYILSPYNKKIGDKTVTEILTSPFDIKNRDNIIRAINNLYGEDTLSLAATQSPSELKEQFERAQAFLISKQEEIKNIAQNDPTALAKLYVEESYIRPHAQRLSFRQEDLQLHKDENYWFWLNRSLGEEDKKRANMFNVFDLSGTAFVPSSQSFTELKNGKNAAWGSLRNIALNSGMDPKVLNSKTWEDIENFKKSGQHDVAVIAQGLVDNGRFKNINDAQNYVQAAMNYDQQLSLFNQAANVQKTAITSAFGSTLNPDEIERLVNKGYSYEDLVNAYNNVSYVENVESKIQRLDTGHYQLHDTRFGGSAFSEQFNELQVFALKAKSRNKNLKLQPYEANFLESNKSIYPILNGTDQENPMLKITQQINEQLNNQDVVLDFVGSGRKSIKTMGNEIITKIKEGDKDAEVSNVRYEFAYNASNNTGRPGGYMIMHYTVNNKPMTKHFMVESENFRQFYYTNDYQDGIVPYVLNNPKSQPFEKRAALTTFGNLAVVNNPQALYDFSNSPAGSSIKIGLGNNYNPLIEIKSSTDLKGNKYYQMVALEDFKQFGIKKGDYIPDYASAYINNSASPLKSFNSPEAIAATLGYMDWTH